MAVMVDPTESRGRSRPPEAPPSSVDADEVARFAALAEEWWDENGPMKPLHALNPTRIAFIRDRVAARLGRDPLGDRPLRGLALLDIGCGGGLLAEPMARLGAEVVGIDAAAESIRVAAQHGREFGLEIDYRNTVAEALAADGERYDVVLNMEVIEHVADQDAVLAASCALVRPGGLLFAATLNRTLQAFAFAIVGAEYILRWLEPGTHDWHRFMRPAELARALRSGGVAVRESTGVRYNPLAATWSLGRDLSVNYMVMGEKESA
jgi:2-polyprenyl-6-hydroxyphenyl methylase/3-demethylubiquinone-9 3-methyltransferase